MKLPLFLLLVLLLAACSPGPSTPQTPEEASPVAVTPTTSLEVLPTSTAASSAIVTMAATATPEATITAKPTTTLTGTAPPTLPASEEEAVLQRGYGTLLLLEGLATLLEEQALCVETGTAEEFEVVGTALFVGTLLEQVEEVLAAEPPDPLFATSWEQAAALVPELDTLLGEWFNEEINAATVIAEVALLRT